MDKSEVGEEDRVTASNYSSSFQSDKREKKITLCKRAWALFRGISLGEYRTPLYFANKDSYKSFTSALLTILSVLTLAIVFLYIFVPIYMKETYKSETK
jgi:polyferredoxin